MKNKTKYLVAILLMLVGILLIGATNVNAVESGVVLDVDLGTVNVGYTDSPNKNIIIQNNGTESWQLLQQFKRDTILEQKNVIIYKIY